MTQQARNVTSDLEDDSIVTKFLLHDRDTKYTDSFDEVFRSQGTTIVKTPFRTPNANALAERFVRTIRSECLDHVVILNQRHLERVLRSYVGHYNEHRPHQGIAQQVPAAEPSSPNEELPAGERQHPQPIGRFVRRDRLGGLIHEYERVA